MSLEQLLAVARGDEPASLIIRNGRVVNVYTGEIETTDVVIYKDQIAALGIGYRGEEEIDVQGAFVAPGLIDAHVHIESSLVTPPEFARAVLPRGVTTVITDPHEIANVHGIEGVRYMLRTSATLPLSVYVMAPSCVPATHMETNGATLEAEDLRPLLDEPRVLGLAEMMNFPGTVYGAPDVLAKLRTFQGRVIDGHCPGLTGRELNAYVAAGIGSDHESTTVEEAQEKLRRGMYIFIREATNARNLHDLLPLVTPINHRRICFCTDDRQPGDLLTAGTIDMMVREAIREGVDPIFALRMATLNPAEYFRLHDRGGLAPGKRADIIVFQDLQQPSPHLVFAGGQLVARDGAVLPTAMQVDPQPTPPSMNVRWDMVHFRVPARGSRIRVIGHIPDQLVTEHLILDAAIQNREVVADPSRDVLKMAVIDRHRGTGRVGLGFIHGFGLRRGAIAGTVAHDHHNLVIIGADDTSMWTAARAVGEMGGGLAVAVGEHVLAQLPLPVAGLMSDRPIEEVAEGYARLGRTAQELGSPLHDPFMAMSFMALEVIPHLKLTDHGLVDVDAFQLVDLFV
ncbi:MAG: adenine deaminase [Chloroflexi bacterium]|nr:adenine deaminase [Chloroflexota bacterium]